jgi:hypothetical protein
MATPPRRFTYDKKLPIAEMPLDHALSNHHDTLSLWENPFEWIEAEANYVQSIAIGVVELTETQNEGLNVATLLPPAMIYQGTK